MFTIIPYGAAVFFAYRGGRFGVGLGSVLWVYGLIVLPITLTLAASRIGPPVENHTTKLRAMALVGLLVGLGYRSLGSDALVLSTVLALAVVVPVVIVSLTEKIRPLPRLYAPFVRRNGLLGWLVMPFAPGWPGGLAFACLVLGLAPFLRVWIDELSPLVFLGIVGTFLVPAAFLHTVLPEKRRTAVIYMTLILLSTGPLYIYGAAHAFHNEMLVVAIESVMGFFPPVFLAFQLWQIPGFSISVATVELLAITGASLVVLVRAARGEWSKVRKRSRPEDTRATIAPVAPAVEGSVS